ncbi:fluoride efflux transporter FluC [Alteriqipengyuania sp. 357]
MTSLSPITASLGVGLGGAIGAVLRYQLSRAMTAWLGEPVLGAFPWATLAANAIGGLAMGILAGCLARGFGGSFAEPVRLMAGVGLLGGFTTFSAFTLETWLLIERGQPTTAFLYVLISVALSLGALVLGLTITRVF